MALFKSENPVFRSSVFDRVGSVSSADQAMTYRGTMAKTGLLFLMLLVTATIGWVFPSIAGLFVMMFAGLAIAVATVLKPEISPFTAPLYAAVEGYVIGVISLVYTMEMQGSKYSGAVPLAILGTLMVFAVMLGLYATRIIKVTETFAMVVIGATIGIGLTYLGTVLIGFFDASIYKLPMFGSGPIGIAFSVFAIVVASLRLTIHFNVIETGVESWAPKYMEWYCGFGLMVTLIWIYLEMLRLLSKLARR